MIPPQQRLQQMASTSGWQRRFDDPIPLPRGRQLLTLKDAADYVMKLPKADQEAPEWQAAIEALMLVVERNGPTIFARIGVMRALNRNVERVFNSERKDCGSRINLRRRHQA